MFVKTVENVRNAGQELVLAGGAAVSTRYLTAADNLGFSLHAVRSRAGASLELWYKHHWEANLILDGILDITDHASRETHRLGPGALYLVGPADRHRIEAVDGVHLVSVFNPPLAGVESHDEDGAYSADGPDSLRSSPASGQIVRISQWPVRPRGYATARAARNVRQGWGS